MLNQLAKEALAETATAPVKAAAAAKLVELSLSCSGKNSVRNPESNLNIIITTKTD